MGFVISLLIISLCVILGTTAEDKGKEFADKDYPVSTKATRSITGGYGPLYVDNCNENEACLFSWTCEEEISMPVRFCSTGPRFQFTVCCNLNHPVSSPSVTPSSPDATSSSTVAIDVTSTSNHFFLNSTNTQGWITSTSTPVAVAGNEATSTANDVATTLATIPTAMAAVKITLSPLLTCGHAPLTTRSARIIGGSAASFGQFPYQVMLEIKGRQTCGGALIGQEWVVTAGHCFSGSVTAQDVIVLLGLWDRTRKTDLLPVQERRVSKIFVHPLFNVGRSFSHDITLIKLDVPVSYTTHIQPVCLPRPDDDFTGWEGTITGWGRLGFREDRPAILQHVQVPIMTNERCERMFEIQKAQEKIIPQMTCAGYDEGGRDACQADSGGPFSVIKDGVYVLAGVVSWGYGCGMPGYPGVFTRMTHFTIWIMETILRESS